MCPSGYDTGDRRRVCRYPAVLRNAVLGWWRHSEFKTQAGDLANLSLSGCLIELDRLPDLSMADSVWLHLHKSSELEWIEGRVIAIKKPLLRKCQVRVLFVGPLGYEPFKKIVYGPGYLGDHIQTPKPDHEHDQFWK